MPRAWEEVGVPVSFRGKEVERAAGSRWGEGAPQSRTAGLCPGRDPEAALAQGRRKGVLPPPLPPPGAVPPLPPRLPRQRAPQPGGGAAR